MKHLVISITIGFSILCGFSCKKDYTCECNSKNTDPNVNSVAVTYQIQYKSVSKQTAKSRCISYKETSTSEGSSTSSQTDCKLK